MSAWDDIRDMDFSNAHSWPPTAKGAVIAVICAVIVIAGLWFFIKPKYETYETAEREEQTLRQTFEDKAAKAANLAQYQQQLEQMRRIYDAMLDQLPNKTEMPRLLEDISQTAVATGIETDLFQPGAEIVHDFYAELPIQLRMEGGYHQFGEFMSEVAALPRIVILTGSNISLKPIEGSSNELVLQGTAKTYRSAEAGENLLSDETEPAP